MLHYLCNTTCYTYVGHNITNVNRVKMISWEVHKEKWSWPV